MSIGVVFGPQAAQRLSDPTFAAQWDALHARCAFATPFLRRSFVEAWRAERPEVALAMAIETSPDGGLVGVLPIARSGDDAWSGFGGAAARRHGWLAQPLMGSYFAERAALALGRQLPTAVIRFESLPSAAPEDWTSRARRAGRIARVEAIEGTEIRLDRADVHHSLDKRANSTQLASLRKLGELERTDDVDDDLLLLGTTWSDRFAEATAKSPNYAPWRRRLLKRVRDQLAVSALVLRAKGRPARAISVIAGYPHEDRLELELVAEDPEHEQWSPAYLHWLMLEPALAKRGVVTVSGAGLPPWLTWLGAPSERRRVQLLCSTADRLRYDATTRVVDLSRWALGRIER